MLFMVGIGCVGIRFSFLFGSFFFCDRSAHVQNALTLF